MSAIAIIIEDDVDYAAMLGKVVRAEGLEAIVTGSGEAGLATLDHTPADVVLTDIGLPGIDGVEVTRRVRELSPGTACIIVSGRATVDTAVAAMRAGAHDFVAKSSDVEELRFRLHKALEVARVLRHASRASEQDDPARALVGESPSMEAVRRQIREVAAAPTATMLVLGETGTGKELVARAIHRLSARRERQLVAVNCASIPRDLLESEFFGHERGAFTGAARLKRGLFEEADGGTLFLDEIGDMDLGLQAKLLRVLEDRTLRRVGGTEDLRIDVRLVAATNQALERLVERGSFRADLFYRLQVFQIALPPLRERRGDVLALAERFIAHYNTQLAKRVVGLEPDAARALAALPFPGNVRQLRNMVERAMIVCAGDRLTSDGLFGAAFYAPATRPDPIADVPAATPADGDLASLQAAVSEAQKRAVELERRLLSSALAKAGGNKLHAARTLGISRYALQRRLRALGEPSQG